LPVLGPGGGNRADAAAAKVLLLDGCVQRVTTPGVNDQLAALLQRRGIGVRSLPGEGCCGGLALHLGDDAGALDAARRNLDAIAPLADELEVIISTASGCGVTLKDYGRLLAGDPDYAPLAAAVAAKVKDAAEYLCELRDLGKARPYRRLAWQAPCTLQHGQQIRGAVETLLQQAGYRLVPVADPHLCCGSAGTYSLLQPALATTLRDRKLAALMAEEPDAIATANVGCQNHLAHGARVPVHHWLELVS
jgi:glycolate oxidase iron-sulfur subunit